MWVEECGTGGGAGVPGEEGEGEGGSGGRTEPCNQALNPLHQPSTRILISGAGCLGQTRPQPTRIQSHISSLFLHQRAWLRAH